MILFSKIKRYITNNTDVYYSTTKKVVANNGDKIVVYAFFLRTDSLYAPLFIKDFLNKVFGKRRDKIKLHELYKEGDFIKSKSPVFFIEGSFTDLCELETLLLQKIGIPFVAAYKAYLVATQLKHVSFISMGARHYANSEVANMVDYGISIGSNVAKKENAKGFLGSSTKEGSKFFGIKEGLGTMPHALIGYAGSTLEAAKMYHATFPNNQLTVLVDFFGKEITDSIEVCDFFKELANTGKIGVRLDTHQARYLEGLDEKKSWQIINKYVDANVIKDFNEEEINFLIGKGVSIAAIFAVKEALKKAGYPLVKVIVSSGFNLAKCSVLSKTNAPVNTVGTGSIITEGCSNLFATADIISYNDNCSVKIGREYLIKEWQNFLNNNNNHHHHH